MNLYMILTKTEQLEAIYNVKLQEMIQLCFSLTAWLWGTHVSALNFSYFLCEIELKVLTVSTHKVCEVDLITVKG